MLFSWLGYFYGVNCIAEFLTAGLSQRMHNQQVDIIHLLMNYLVDVDITCGISFSNIARVSITSSRPPLALQKIHCTVF